MRQLKWCGFGYLILSRRRCDSKVMIEISCACSVKLISNPPCSGVFFESVCDLHLGKCTRRVPWRSPHRKTAHGLQQSNTLMMCNFQDHSGTGSQNVSEIGCADSTLKLSSLSTACCSSKFFPWRNGHFMGFLTRQVSGGWGRRWQQTSNHQSCSIFDVNPTQFHQRIRWDPVTLCRLDLNTLNKRVEFLVFRHDKLTFLFSWRRHFFSARSGLLQICCVIFHEKLTVTNKMSGSTDCASVEVHFPVLWPWFRSQACTVLHVRRNCSTEDTFPSFEFSNTYTFTSSSSLSYGFGGRWTKRDAWTLFTLNFLVQQWSQGAFATLATCHLGQTKVLKHQCHLCPNFRRLNFWGQESEESVTSAIFFEAKTNYDCNYNYNHAHINYNYNYDYEFYSGKRERERGHSGGALKVRSRRGGGRTVTSSTNSTLHWAILEFSKSLVFQHLSQQQVLRRESSVSMWVIVSCGAFIKDFLNCDTVRNSSNHTNCRLFDCIKSFPKHSCFPGRVSRIKINAYALGK